MTTRRTMLTETETHRTHDVRRYDGGHETRYDCRTCHVRWSDMRIAQYARIYAREEE